MILTGREGTHRCGSTTQISQELRDRAVRPALESALPIVQIAADLGICREALRTWVRQAQADAGQLPEQLTTDEREELKRLRKENNELNALTKSSKRRQRYSPPSSASPGGSSHGGRPPA